MQQTVEKKVSSNVAKLAAVFASFAFMVAAHPVRAAVGPPVTDPAKADDQLEELVVTGSLIPQAKIETATPVVTLTIEDIQTKGFATIADALQHSAFSTGGIQGGNTTNAFTQGANTISLFGLNPGYTKFLIDGRPIADYPALYNGTDSFVNISGIPTLLIESIDELPGAQSSIYGSDAIAGVINIRLRKKMDGPEIDARYGWSGEGGGVNKRLAIADGFTFGGVNVVVGGQYEKTDPIWNYKRKLTDHYFGGNPNSPEVAERDWLVLGTFGNAAGDLYYYNNVDPGSFPGGQIDPSQCGNVAGQFNGTEGLRSRSARGQYCGTYQASPYTLSNGTEATQGYVHLSDEISEHLEIYADLLVDHDVARFGVTTGAIDTANDNGPFSYFYDPRIGDLMNIQHFYTPEEVGGVRNTMDKDTTNSLRTTIGMKGDFGNNWNYDASFTYTENKLTEAYHMQFTSQLDAFYSAIMGPQLPGVDPFFGQYPIYEPDYASFFKPITAAQYNSFSGMVYSRSRTEDSLLRVQLTDSKLFPLPGGNAGLAIVAEAGGQGWDYDPDPRYLDGETYLYSSTAGSGHRARYALTTELKLPLAKMLTTDLSGRYDEYRAAGETVAAGTYNLGLEFRPINNLLLRGRFGTAFKAPTLADEFQGPSGYFIPVNDYYGCAVQGYQGNASCPYFGNNVAGETTGNTHLQPITAKVWDIGIAYAPVPHSNFTADFIRWRISNEVATQDTQRLVTTDGDCLDGTLDPTTPTCVNAIAQVQRDANGLITLISTPKVNIASESLSVFVVGLSYEFPTAYAGTFVIDGHYTDLLRHRFTQFPGDAEINLLEDPFYNTDFKTKENMSFTWNYKKVGTTLYVERYGRTPNFAATQAADGYAEPYAGRIGTWTLANLEVQYEALPGLVLSGHVNNIANKMPPEDNTYLGIDSAPYNNLDYNPYGRSFYVEATYKYGKGKH